MQPLHDSVQPRAPVAPWQFNGCSSTLNRCARRRASLHLRDVVASPYTLPIEQRGADREARDGDQEMKFGHLFIAIAALAGAIFMVVSAPAHAQLSAASRGEVLVLQ